MTKPNPFLWPKNSCVFIRDGRGRELASSTDRRFDLANNIAPDGWGQRTVVVALSIDGGIAVPSSEEADRLERLIREDLGADGYDVTLTKLETNGFDTYAWRVRVRPALPRNSS